MNALKNFEAMFVIALGLACAANYAFDNNALDSAAPAPASFAAAAGPAMPVVVVSAKRMTPAEKEQSLAAQRKDESSKI